MATGEFYFGRFIKLQFVEEARLLGTLGLEKVREPFLNMDEQATAYSVEAYAKMMPPHGEGTVDDALAANDAGDNYHYMLYMLSQSVNNLFAAGLYHLFRQQQGVYRWLIPAGVERVEMRSLPQWATLHELGLVANTAKHAKGRSEQELRKLRPDLFENPLFRDVKIVGDHSWLLTPLSGVGLYVAEADLKAYGKALEEAWLAISEEHMRRGTEPGDEAA